MQNQFGRILSYPTAQFPFRLEVERILGVTAPLCLESLVNEMAYTHADHHRQLQGSPWHRRFYAGWEELAELYLAFVHWIGERLNILPGRLVYQKVPTFRLHACDSMAVGAWHRDSDSEYGHDPSEINVWLPLTRAAASNSLWIRSLDGIEAAMELEYGQVLLFDACTLAHGNRTNDTGQTRVSFDFRVANRCEWRGGGADAPQSVSAGKALRLGEYYALT